MQVHPKYTDCLKPVTKEADIGHSYTYTDTSRMWTQFVSADGEEVVTRVGWWGDEYDLLRNNCCFLADHLLKILTGKPLPSWIFSLAKVGDGLAHGLHFMHDATADGIHRTIEMVSHAVGGPANPGPGYCGCCEKILPKAVSSKFGCCGGKPAAEETAEGTRPRP